VAALAVAGGATQLVPRLVAPGPTLSAAPDRPLAIEARPDGYLARGDRYNALLRPSGALVALWAPLRFERDPFGRRVPQRTPPRQAGFAVRFLDASSDAAATVHSPLAPVQYVNRSGSETRRTFAQVVFHGVYPGIDLSHHGTNTRLQSDWLVGPGADPRRIRLGFSGLDKLARDAHGGIELSARGLQAFLTKPVAYQVVAGSRRRVPASWRMDGRTLSFALGAYDRARPLVIDPKLEGTLEIGGNSDDTILDIDSDSAGNLVAVGGAVDSNFPRVGNGPFQPGGDFDAVVVAISPTLQVLGTAILGGSGDDFFQRVVAEAPGEWIVSGSTTSFDFPVPHALDSTYGGGTCAGAPCFDGLLLAFGNGNLRFASYVGGSLDDQITSIALDRSARGGQGLLAFGGASNSPQFIRSAGYDEFVGAVQYDAVEHLQSGSSYQLKSYGGRGNDAIFGTAVRGNDVYAVGGSRSTSEVTPGEYSQFENAFALVSHDGGATWQDRVFANPGTYSELDSVVLDSDGTPYAGFIGFFPGGNYGACSFGKCQPAGFVKLDPATLEPGSVATLVPPLNGRYTLLDVDALRNQGGAISALGAALNLYPTFASSATPTGIGVIVPAGTRCTGTCPRIASQVQLPAGALASGAAFTTDSLFLGGAAPEGVLPGVKGEADGFVAKIVDLGLTEAAASCKCVSITLRGSSVKVARRSVSFTLNWTMRCTGGTGKCEGELEVHAPPGAKISSPKRAVHCGPGSCTSSQKGTVRVEATGARAARRYTFAVKEWCLVNGARRALPTAHVTVTSPGN
jgi:hypothetical protein